MEGSNNRHMEVDLTEMSSRLSEEIGTESWSSWKTFWLQEMKTAACLDGDLSDRKRPPWWRFEAAEWWDGETGQVHAHMHWSGGASPEAGAAGEAPEGDLCSKREIPSWAIEAGAETVEGDLSTERKDQGRAVGAGDGHHEGDPTSPWTLSADFRCSGEGQKHYFCFLGTTKKDLGNGWPQLHNLVNGLESPHR